jgi:transcriptional regulator with GAF, ATPase, and Fis domain
MRSIGYPVLNNAGDLVEFLGTTIDITEQVEARTALENALTEVKLLRDHLYQENLVLKEEIDQASMFEEIVGSSEPLQRVLVQVAKVAPTDSTALIFGETGTGKELIARAIHKRSRRSESPFIRVNCSAIPQSLIASELFGHERGAFTGAIERRIGRFEAANRGTLFLDEVGELPMETQLTLLRVLQERELERVGSSRPIPIDVRVVAATNRDLEAALADGTFRRDLFYRLNVFPIHIPPLRERADDIPMLVEYLIERYAKKAGKKFDCIRRTTQEQLQAYDWPGNIRELQNVIERTVVLSDGGTFAIDDTWLKRKAPSLQGPSIPLDAKLTEREKEMIETALRESRGKVSGPFGAAEKLGIPRQTLDSRILSLKIDKRQFKRSTN